tara:strand:- start:56 stop:961 length:906 start_codon:yes stop_codon:yes gene_type:complete
METLETKKNRQKTPKKFHCEKCDYHCSKQSDFNRHLHTRKHNLETNGNKNAPKNAIRFECVCGKDFSSKSGLWKHKKKCCFKEKFEKNENNDKIKKEINLDDVLDEKEDSTYKKMLIEMMEENKEMRKTIQGMIPKIGGDINSHNTNNVNINVFLNEQCKDALNIMDFVKSLQLQLQDLENTGKLGFVEGTSKIFINGLKELEITKRPIHCSDIQTETLYVKDNDTWEKDNDNRDKMKMAIDEVSKANMKQLPKWVTENKSFLEDEEYMKVISNIMTKLDEEGDKDKIINNIAKETVIDNN